MLRKLLLIDDDADCRRITRHYLSRAGYDVIEADDGLAGYERVLADTPDIIITDWEMPRLDGLDLIRRIRAAQLDWYPYIVLVTASADAELGLDTGADDFLSKPIRENELLPRVRAGQRIVSLQARLNEQNQRLNGANLRLAQLATTDSLTGLLNRRAFHAAAEVEWLRCQRHAIPLSCLMIDIDFFKRVNDIYGHLTGDAVIVHVAKMLKSRLRETDLLCRYGGEEFCIWLVNTPLSQADAVAHEMCAQAGRLIIPEIGSDFSLTVSIGISERNAGLPSQRALIERADQALLYAKQTGRNRAVRFERRHATSGAAVPPNRPLDPQSLTVQQNPPALPPRLVRALRTALSLRDPQLGLQIERRWELCRELGGALRLDAAQLDCLELAAQLADVGWLATTDRRPIDGGVPSQSASSRRGRALEATLAILRDAGADATLLALVPYRDCWLEEAPYQAGDDQIPVAGQLLGLATAFVELCDAADDGANETSSAAAAAAIDSLNLRAGPQFVPELIQRLSESFAGQVGHDGSRTVPVLI